MNSPDPDRLRYAQIAGAAARHAQGWRLTADEEARAIAELTEAAAGRADLLAEHAGTALGFGEGRPDAARYQQIAELCIAAGADQALIERWINVGRERAAAATAIPYTGHPPSGLMFLAPERRAWHSGKAGHGFLAAFLSGSRPASRALASPVRELGGGPGEISMTPMGTPRRAATGGRLSSDISSSRSGPFGISASTSRTVMSRPAACSSTRSAARWSWAAHAKTSPGSGAGSRC
jgi:hypothetical protein